MLVVPATACTRDAIDHPSGGDGRARVEGGAKDLQADRPAFLIDDRGQIPLGWSRVRTNETLPLYALWGDAQRLWIVGAQGVILSFSFGRLTTVASPVTSDLRAIWGSGPRSVWAVGYPVIHFDGQSWRAKSAFSKSQIRGVWGFAADDIWIVGGGDSTGPAGIIARYTGANWRQVHVATRGLEGIWGSARAELWAVGKKGLVVRFDGKSWTETAAGLTDQDLWAVWGSARDDIWVVGDRGTILHFAGATWKRVSTTSADRLIGIWGAAGNDIWIVGGQGTILHFDGQKWSRSSFKLSDDLFYVWGRSADEVWAAGARGTLLRYRK